MLNDIYLKKEEEEEEKASALKHTHSCQHVKN